MRPLLFSLLFCSGAAYAQAAAPAHPEENLKKEWESRFRLADKDNSRSLDRAEAQAGLPKILSRNFDRIDLDRSGSITPAELWAMHEREVAAREKRRAERLAGPPR
ncbi:MAG: hypothetical protein HYZ32_00525 [Hydrocarboniphaga effusa]|nr:hypothetical protein [Hydrocarboniphaga effusa]